MSSSEQPPFIDVDFIENEKKVISEPGSGFQTPTRDLYKVKFNPFLEIWQRIVFRKYNIIDVYREERDGTLRKTLSDQEWQEFYEVNREHPGAGFTDDRGLKVVTRFFFKMAVNWNIPLETIQTQAYDGQCDIRVKEMYETAVRKHLHERTVQLNRELMGQQ